MFRSHCSKGSLLDEKHPTTSVLVRSTNVSTTTYVQLHISCAKA